MAPSAGETLHWFDAAWLWGLIATLIGLGAIWAAVAALRVRRPHLWWYVAQSTPLIAHEGATSAVEINYASRQLTNPHVLSLVFKCASKRDITSNMFDQSRPVVFEVDADIVAPLSIGWFGHSKSGFALGLTTVSIRPSLIAAGSSARIVVITDGVPNPKLAESSLQDSEVVRYSVVRTPSRVRILRRAYLTTVLAFVIYAVYTDPVQASSYVGNVFNFFNGLLSEDSSPSSTPPQGALLALIITGSAASVGLGALVADRQLRRIAERDSWLRP